MEVYRHFAGLDYTREDSLTIRRKLKVRNVGCLNRDGHKHTALYRPRGLSWPFLPIHTPNLLVPRDLPVRNLMGGRNQMREVLYTFSEVDPDSSIPDRRDGRKFADTQIPCLLTCLYSFNVKWDDLLTFRPSTLLSSLNPESRTRGFAIRDARMHG